MIFKKAARALVLLCVAVSFITAACGCADLGAFNDLDEYYGSFGDVVTFTGMEKEWDSFSVEEYFYNEESRDDFLKAPDGTYEGMPAADYLYLAIPLEASLTVDSLALYLLSEVDSIVLLSLFIVDELPENPRGTLDPEKEIVFVDGVEAEQDIEYDDPPSESAVGNILVRLTGGEWNSFLIDAFTDGRGTRTSIEAKSGQFILIQIRNNSAILTLDEQTSTLRDPIIDLAVERVDLTFTNLLLRALDVSP